MKKWISTLCLATLVQFSWASSWTGSEILMYGVVGLCIVLSLIALILIATNMMNLEAHKYGIDVRKQNFSAVPGASDFGDDLDKHE
jgi:hypothetical protein